MPECSLGNYHKDQEEVERGVLVRLRRQELLDQPYCPELRFVLDEAVLHRWLGGPVTMRQQLDHLKDISRHPRVSLRIVPFIAGMHAGMLGFSFAVFTFRSQDGVVILEDPTRDELVDDPELTDMYNERFHLLEEVACPDTDVDKIIDPVIERMHREAAMWVGDQVVQSAVERSQRGRARRRRATVRTSETDARAEPRHAMRGQGAIQGHAVVARPSLGIVTAIPEELVAMHALLDSPVGSHLADDPAEYALATLPSRDAQRPHGVALTRLVATATNAAATGCANMLRSFPSIGLVIMVGIAAGVPNLARPRQHVRLGDIVVATQIVDYDHVRVVESGAEARRPFSLPSARLTHCADMLRSDELGGHRPWERWLDTAGRPQLALYGRPPEHTDMLHDGAGWLLRHPRRDHSGHRKGLPKVHYGPVGSANRSLRDSAVRDQLAARYGVLAIEMEGAGIGSSSFLNGREWFVVRGISDYGDQRRSDQWRRYAALVAAAYIRALLAKCLPFEPLDGPSRFVPDS